MTSNEVIDVFIENVESLLKKKGWSKSELARQLEVTLPVVSRMLGGKRAPNAGTMADVATALGVDVCDLLCKTKKKKP